jgi:hypothetical protein
MLQCAWDLGKEPKNVDKILVGSHVEVILFFFIFFSHLGPVCLSSGSTAAIEAYCA